MAHSGVRAGRDAQPPGDDALLLLARPADAGAAAYCRHHLSRGGGTDQPPIVLVTGRDGVDGFPAGVGDDRRGVVVAIDGGSSPSASPGPTPPTSPPETVTVAADPGAVGRTVDGYLTAWAAAGHRPAVCVAPLSTLRDAAPVRTVYRLFFVLVRRTCRVGGTLHVHATPRDHEEEILATFHAPFDRVISFQGGGSDP